MNGVVENFQQFILSAMSVWYNTLEIIINYLTKPLNSFFSPEVWSVIQNIASGLESVGVGIFAICFFIGVINTSASYVESKRPEQVFKLVFRGVISYEVILHASDIMQTIMSLAQDIASKVLEVKAYSPNPYDTSTLPDDVTKAFEEWGKSNFLNFFAQIPLAIVAIIMALVVFVCTVILLITVYARFFKLYIYTAVAPIPIATFAGQPTARVGKGFLKSYIGVALEAVIMIIAILIFNIITQNGGGLMNVVMNGNGYFEVLVRWMLNNIINILLLITIVRGADRLTREMMGP